ncbi:AMP-dependent synthetase [Betaproteobacteria bacterium PRO7]|nr:AMP-dependent synthetase [Betaproteobacteria bacterium PRO7]
MLQLATLIERQARCRGPYPALTFDGETHDYARFAERVHRTANALAVLGIRRGDKVATVLANCRELVELYWAAPSLGAVNVPLSPLLLGPGLASLLADSHATCVVTQRSMLPVVESIRAELPQPLASRVLLVDGEAPGCLDLRALADRAPAVPPNVRVGQDELFNIMYTSGTTGLPKGIMHSHFVRSMYCVLMASRWRMTPESVVLHTGAIVFNGAFVTLMPCFYLGAHYVLARQFDARAAIALIERYRVTHTMMVPAQIVALLDAPNFAPEKLASLQMILSLGAPLHQEQKDRLNRLLPGRFYELYGLTEGFVTVLDVTESTRKSGSVGVPPPFYEMRIVREDGTDAAPREVGEIVGRGPILMDGYYGRPDLTAQAIRDGWLYSGDMGYVDEEGYLYLVDRKKDMIDSGGVKVYPKDIEEIAARHPEVREVAVFGVPDDKWGETPVAAVVLRHPGAAVEDELRAWINARVSARYQRVARVIVMDEFPRNAAGKTLKRELREPFWRGRERRI